MQKNEFEGTVSEINDEKNFGFIESLDFPKLFFFQPNISSNFQVGDRVVFEVRASKKYSGKQEGCFLRKVYKLPNYAKVVFGRSALLPGVKEKVLEVLPTLKLNVTEKEQEITTTFNEVVGKSYCVKTSSNDIVFFAKRGNKPGYTRFVEGREPEETRSLTLVFAMRNGYFVILAAFFGEGAQPEWWDKNSNENSESFWARHALIPHDAFKIDMDTRSATDPMK